MAADLPAGAVLGLAFVLGAVIGSFLNVCILRWGAEPKESVVRPPSRCPHCGYGLRAWDNVPIVSWLLLLGKCRRCRAPISPLYPVVELAAGLIFAFMAYRHGPTLEALRGATFATILLGIAVTDARRYIIPDEFSVGGMVLGLGFAAVAGLDPLIDAVIGAAAGFGGLWIVGALGAWIFKKEAMGGGDVKMLGMVGAFLGWPGVLLTLFLGALVGSLIFVPINLMGREKLVPFGIFLAIGAAVGYLWGPAMVDGYLAYSGLR